MKKVSIPTQVIYLFVLSFLLITISLLFSFYGLVPQGKEYRNARIDLKKEQAILDQYQQQYDETYEQLKDLQSKNEHIIRAYENSFRPDRFIKMYKELFDSLELKELKHATKAEPFFVYRVDTISKITSPQKFYEFLEAINKSDWIIQIDFPITFERDKKLIKSTFTMKIFSNENQLKEEKEEKDVKKTTTNTNN
jgi:hypothetical protein